MAEGTVEIDQFKAEIEKETATAIALKNEGKIEEATEHAKMIKKLQKQLEKKQAAHDAEETEYASLANTPLEQLQADMATRTAHALELKNAGDKEGAVEEVRHIKVLKRKIEELGGSAAAAPASPAPTPAPAASSVTPQDRAQALRAAAEAAAQQQDLANQNESDPNLTPEQKAAIRYAKAAQRQKEARDAELATLRSTKREYEDNAPTRHTQPADERQWVLQQKKAFSGWVNFTLAQRGLFLQRDIAVAFDDGLQLIPFIEILCEDKCMKHVANPRMRVQKVENINLAMSLLRTHGHIPDASNEDIADGNGKMVLGFIYQLFVKFVGGDNDKNASDALLQWVQGRVNDGKYAGVEIKGWTSDWSDGLGFCALMNSLSDDFLKFGELDREQPVASHVKAYHSANVNLGVPALLDPNDMVNFTPDDKSVKMYVQLIKAAWDQKGKLAAEKAAADRAAREAMPKEDVWKIVDELRAILNGGRCPQCGYCFSTIDERGQHVPHPKK